MWCSAKLSASPNAKHELTCGVMYLSMHLITMLHNIDEFRMRCASGYMLGAHVSLDTTLVIRTRQPQHGQEMTVGMAKSGDASVGATQALLSWCATLYLDTLHIKLFLFIYCMI